MVRYARWQLAEISIAVAPLPHDGDGGDRMSGSVRIAGHRKRGKGADDRFEVMDLTEARRRFEPNTIARWIGIRKYPKVFLVDETESTGLSVLRRGRRRRLHEYDFPRKAGESRKRLLALLDGRKHSLRDVFGVIAAKSIEKGLERLRRDVGDRLKDDGGYEIIHSDSEHVWFELRDGERGFWRRRVLAPVRAYSTKHDPMFAQPQPRLVAHPRGFYRRGCYTGAVLMWLEDLGDRPAIAQEFGLLYRDTELTLRVDVDLLRELYPDREWLSLEEPLRADPGDRSQAFWCGFYVPPNLEPGKQARKLRVRVRGRLMGGRRPVLETKVVTLVVDNR